MEDIGKIKEKHNCLVVSLAGDQTFVEILTNQNKLLIRSQSRGVTEIRHKDVPGEYKVKTDGTIKKLSSIKLT